MFSPALPWQVRLIQPWLWHKVRVGEEVLLMPSCLTAAALPFGWPAFGSGLLRLETIDQSNTFKRLQSTYLKSPLAELQPKSSLSQLPQLFKDLGETQNRCSLLFSDMLIWLSVYTTVNCLMSTGNVCSSYRKDLFIYLVRKAQLRHNIWFMERFWFYT